MWPGEERGLGAHQRRCVRFCWQPPQTDEAAPLGARRIRDVLQASGAGALPSEDLLASGHRMLTILWD